MLVFEFLDDTAMLIASGRETSPEQGYTLDTARATLTLPMSEGGDIVLRYAWIDRDTFALYMSETLLDQMASVFAEEIEGLVALAAQNLQALMQQKGVPTTQQEIRDNQIRTRWLLGLALLVRGLWQDKRAAIFTTLALLLVFGEHAERLQVSSTKGYYGHALGASGAFEVAISALAGLLTRTVHPVVPPHVDYEITPLGRTTLPAIEALQVGYGDSIAIFGVGGVGLSAVMAARSSEPSTRVTPCTRQLVSVRPASQV